MFPSASPLAWRERARSGQANLPTSCEWPALGSKPARTSHLSGSDMRAGDTGGKRRCLPRRGPPHVCHIPSLDTETTASFCRNCSGTNSGKLDILRLSIRPIREACVCTSAQRSRTLTGPRPTQRRCRPASSESLRTNRDEECHCDSSSERRSCGAVPCSFFPTLEFSQKPIRSAPPNARIVRECPRMRGFDRRTRLLPTPTHG